MTKLQEEFKKQRELHRIRLVRESDEFMSAYDSAALAVFGGEDAEVAIDQIAPMNQSSNSTAQGAMAGAYQAKRLLKLDKEGKL